MAAKVISYSPWLVQSPSRISATLGGDWFDEHEEHRWCCGALSHFWEGICPAVYSPDARVRFVAWDSEPDGKNYRVRFYTDEELEESEAYEDAILISDEWLTDEEHEAFGSFTGWLESIAPAGDTAYITLERKQ